MNRATTIDDATANFRASGYHWRLFCGAGVVEQHLLGAVKREGASRVMVVCSPSVAKRTDLIER